MRFINNSVYIIFIIDLILTLLHLIVPEYEWGQGRDSYFNLNNNLTLAAWLCTVQLAVVSLISLTNYYIEKRVRKFSFNFNWIIIAFLSGAGSIFIITDLPLRLNLFNINFPNIYNQFLIISLILIAAVFASTFLFNRIRKTNLPQKDFIILIVLSAAYLISEILTGFNSLLYFNIALIVNTAGEISFLFGITYLLKITAGYSYTFHQKYKEDSFKESIDLSTDFENESNRKYVYAGVAGLTFIIIFLQIILFRLLYIFGDHLTATGVISIALLGISIGGLIGWQAADKNPLKVILVSSFLLPLSILSTTGTVYGLTESPVIASIFLMIPFICASIIITIILAKAKAYKVYATDLIGAAVGALIVGFSLYYFREESSILFLTAFAFIIAAFFIKLLPEGFLQKRLITTAAIASLIFIILGYTNLEFDWLNIIRTKVEVRFPDAKFYESRSSLVGRYDLLRRSPTSSTVKAYENGRVIDNLRDNQPDEYVIDPRIPNNFIEDPEILILGLSGDGVTKTARAISNSVYGVEINPVVVELQMNELVELNGNSYKNINVFVMDGRSYIEETDKKFDMITLMNAHSAKGYTEGRSASPEYLHTKEAFESYFDHLTDDGIIIIEEPINTPEREPPVWKMVYTMRQALLSKGIKNTESHFFIYQWKTTHNNYIQVLMKRTPFTETDIELLHQWLYEFDYILEIEDRAGRRLGPIRGKSTILFEPGIKFETNYARLVEGRIDNSFKNKFNLGPTTDNKPFHFNVDPRNTEVKTAYLNTLFISLLLLPFILTFIRKNKDKLNFSFTYSLIVGLTGLAYLLVEVVFIEKLEIFLGSPTITFATVLGTLLIFSGLGSYVSGKMNANKVYAALLFIILFLLLQNFFLFDLFKQSVSLPMILKVLVSIITIAPLAFCMGIPFPFILRNSKNKINANSVAILFAINGAASAIAVPLAINISTVYGFNLTFLTGVIVYLFILLILFFIDNKKVLPAANILTVLVIGFILLFPFFRSGEAKINSNDVYNVYAVSYGNSRFSEAKLFKGGETKDTDPFEWMFWIIKNDERTILIDTGFDNPELAKKWGIDNYVKPVDRLKQIGIAPEDISDIIITHTHWDHNGSIASFPNAQLWIQKVEYENAAKSINENISYRNRASGQYIFNLVEAEKENRLNLVSEHHQLYDGIELFKGGAHTTGYQFVSVETAVGKVLIAGDETYMYENNQKHIPIGASKDYQKSLSTIKRMHTMAASPFYIIPGHDPRVIRWFPTVSENIVNIYPIEN